jgi:hypothetical protein
MNAAAEKLVLQGLLKGIANGALAVCATHVQRNLVHALDLGSNLGPAEDKADLRTVSMPDGHIPSGLDHVGDMERGFPGSIILVFDRLTLLILDQ